MKTENQLIANYEDEKPLDDSLKKNSFIIHVVLFTFFEIRKEN